MRASTFTTVTAALVLCTHAFVADAAKSPRLLSLAPGLTEIAYAAGAGGLLVGRVAGLWLCALRLVRLLT